MTETTGARPDVPPATGDARAACPSIAEVDDGAVVVAFTTVADEAQARRLAADVVRQRLAACAQRETIASTYVWRDALHDEAEVRLVFKTTRGRLAALRAAVLAAHPYELPAFHALAACDVAPAYARWVAASVAPADAAPPGGEGPR